MQNAVTLDARLSLAKANCYVHVPRLDRDILLSQAEPWDLLNLDVDEVCGMSMTVAEAAGIGMPTLTSILDKYTNISLGINEFAKQNDLVKTPVFFSPATNHYSWPKAATLLGLGEKLDV